MATRRESGAAPALGGLGRSSELRQRLLFVLGAVLVFRVGSFIPVPGIDPVALEQLFDQQRGTILDMFNMFSGGARHLHDGLIAELLVQLTHHDISIVFF